MAEKFALDKQRPFLEGRGKVAFELDASSHPDVAKALKDDGPLPLASVDLLDLELTAGAREAVTFRGPVAVSARVGVGGRILLREGAAAAAEALALDEDVAPAVGLLNDHPLFLLLQRSYSAGLSGEGAMALGASPGGVTFALDGTLAHGVTVVRAVPADMTARTALAQVVNDWRPPKTVTSADGDAPLEPGTWLVTETEGSLEVGVGVTYGYAYSWLRKSALGGLEGDVGLRLGATAEAHVGFQTAGRYAVVLARPDQADTLRVRLHRLRKRGWSFGFDARVGVSAALPDVPGTPLDLGRAMLGTHGVQLLDDLSRVRDFAESDQAIDAAVSQVVGPRLPELLRGVFGDGVDADLEDAKGKVADLLDRVRGADDRVVAFLVSEIQKRTDAATDVDAFVEPLRDGLARLRGSMDVVEDLRGVLADAEFFTSPLGAWISEIVGDGVLGILAEDGGAPLDALLRRADETLGLLTDDDPTQSSLLSRLLGELRRGFGMLDRLVDGAAAAATFTLDDLDPWATEKLADFLGQRPEVQADLDRARAAFAELFARGDTLYEAGLRAATAEYELRLSTAVQTTSTRDALVDLTFDFSDDEDGAVAQAYRDVLDGKLVRVLLEPPTGVTVHAGVLTHGVSRRAHLELSLPWMDRKVTKLTDAVASLRFAEQDGTLYGLAVEARNTVLAQNDYSSSLSLSVSLGAGGGVRSFSTEGFRLEYGLRHAFDELSETRLLEYLRPWEDAFFRGAFRAPGHGTLTRWVGDLDNVIDAMEPENGAGRFGDTLLNLSVSLPSTLAAAWLEGPTDADHVVYESLGTALQSELKRLFAAFHFADPSRYIDLDVATAFLVYAATPPVVLRGRHWVDEFGDLTDRDHPVLRDEVMIPRLARRLGPVFHVIRELPDDAHRADHYRPDRASHFLIDLRERRMGLATLRRLLAVEKKIVNGARASALAAARARVAWQEATSGSRDRDKAAADALDALRHFGRSVTETFNEEIDVPFAKGMARPLGGLVFAAGARALGGQSASAVAKLDLSVVRNGAFDLSRYAEGAEPDPDDILIRQSILGG